MACTWLAVPLVDSGGANMGLLQLSDKQRGEFSEDDQLVAMQFAQMASIAIERARLIEKLSVRDRFFEMSAEVFVIFNPAERRFAEVNPMLGHRGVRLAITYPEILKMQIEALCAGAVAFGIGSCRTGRRCARAVRRRWPDRSQGARHR